MEAKRLSVLLPLVLVHVLLVLGRVSVVRGDYNYHHHHTKLFVFGDSYADTGNNARPTSESWQAPYGMSWPGEPDGRWSDGFALTDYIAKYMRMRSPVPFRSWRKHGRKKLKYGVNFAFGGTGVFNTDMAYPNMTMQINLFRRLVKMGVYNTRDLRNSVALVSLVGNDYAYYVSKHGPDDLIGIMGFLDKVYHLLAHNVKRIRRMGVKQVMVTSLPPLGCLPRIARAQNYTCNDEFNFLVGLHNFQLNSTISQMNANETLEHSLKYTPYLFLDLYNPFISIINGTLAPHSGKPAFEKPLEACCDGVTRDYYCASVEKNGTKMYTLCNDPGARLFWDRSHPTQRGWKEIMYFLKDSLSLLRFPHKRL